MCKATTVIADDGITREHSLGSDRKVLVHILHCRRNTSCVNPQLPTDTSVRRKARMLIPIHVHHTYIRPLWKTPLSIHLHHLGPPRPALLQTLMIIKTTAPLPITRPQCLKPRCRRTGLPGPSPTTAARSRRLVVAALAGALDRAAVVAADDKAVDGAHGGQAGADVADGVFDNGPNDGVDVGPCGCQVGLV